MDRYSSYKDSGISWIGEIPSHWDIRRFKSFFFVANGNGFKIEYQGRDSGDYPFLKVSDLNGALNIVSTANNYITEQIVEKESLKIIPKGSILFSKIGEALKKNHRKINTIPCCIDNNCSALIRKENMTEEIDIDFAYYVMRCVDMTWFDNGGTIPCVNMRKFMTSSFSLPSLAEQEKIVSYLEDKTSKIDAYVADKEKEIELLQELKQKTIADAVTKGLNPDAKMKNSGISWIGDIPEHWEVKKIGSLFVERREKVSDKEFPALSVSKQGVTPQLDTAVKTDNGDNRKKVCKNDFVVNSRSDRKGSCGVSPYTGSVSLINIVLSPRENIEVQYFHHLFRSNNYIEEYYRIGRGIVADLWTTRYSEMRNIFVPLPPKDEQQSIVAYIEEKSELIDKLASELLSEIDYLKEYKQRLIADCVTGQVNVQNEMI